MQELGVNCIELMPCHEFNELEYYSYNSVLGDYRYTVVFTFSKTKFSPWLDICNTSLTPNEENNLTRKRGCCFLVYLGNRMLRVLIMMYVNLLNTSIQPFTLVLKKFRTKDFWVMIGLAMVWNRIWCPDTLAFSCIFRTRAG